MWLSTNCSKRLVMWKFSLKSWKQEFRQPLLEMSYCPAFDKQASFTNKNRNSEAQEKAMAWAKESILILLLNICWAATIYAGWELGTDRSHWKHFRNKHTAMGLEHASVQVASRSFSFLLWCNLFFSILLFSLFLSLPHYILLLRSEHFNGPFMSHASKQHWIWNPPFSFHHSVEQFSQKRQQLLNWIQVSQSKIGPKLLVPIELPDPKPVRNK